MSAVNTTNSLYISVQDLTLSDEASKKTTSEQQSPLTTISTSSKGLSSSISPSIQSLSPLSPSFSSVSAGSDISALSLSPSPGISLSTQTGSSYFGSSSSILRSVSPSSLPPTTSLKPPSSMHIFQNQTNKKINITEAENLEKIEEIFQRTSIVLIAEDTPSIQRTLAFAFTKNNIPFILVGDGSEIVNAFQGRDIHIVSTNLKSTRHSDFQIKALLSDEQMPHLNGSEALQQIRPSNPDLIAYSYTTTCDPGSPDIEAVREKLQKFGFNGVFGKKILPKDLIAPFKKALNIS